MPSDRQRVGVPVGSTTAIPVDMALLNHQTIVDPASEGGGGAQRAPSGVPPASEVTYSTDTTAYRPGQRENQGPGVVPVEEGYPVRQRRPPASLKRGKSV